MRNKFFVVAMMIFFAAFSANAQESFKIGYTNVDYILSAMPEARAIESRLNDYSQQYESQLQAKMKEFETKANDYRENVQTWLPEIRTNKEQELQSLQQSIQSFQQQAETNIQKKQMELLQPVYEKIQKAIDEVRVENGYDFILSANQGVISIVLSADQKYDVSELVFKKLGVTPPADSSGAPTGTPAPEEPAEGAGGN